MLQKLGCEFHRKNTIIIGSGAAGLNAAIHFVEEGGDPDQIIIATEQLGGGTSFNAGSDKQTYYKLSLGGSETDNVREMANTYWEGGSMHGDIALVESANSIREFIHLVSLGVPFPTNSYGEYIGYKTDNDPKQRATSAGPLTSHLMGIKLLERVKRLGISLHDHIYCFKILEYGNLKLVLGLKIDNLSMIINSEMDFKRNCVVYLVDNLIVATGGSSSIYSNSVYPLSQRGSLGMLIEFGCITQNLTESQFGLASIDFRWNVSGTFQQVIPTYLSYYPDAGIESAQEFLNDHFPSNSHLLDAIFLKGYQWPFNTERIHNYGSSYIDLLVFKEITEKKRIVVLDYCRNPGNLSISQIFCFLGKKYREYLQKSGIDENTKFDLPVNRLRKINPKAYDLYLSHGIDLAKLPLKVSICAQHCNGGISGDIWWESSKPGVFVIGEANGSHGVHRPGGAALNSGQVGGLRASLKIIKGKYGKQMETQTEYDTSKIENLINTHFSKIYQISQNLKKNKNSHEILKSIQLRMEKYGTIIRRTKNLQNEIDAAISEIINFFNIVSITKPSVQEFLKALRTYDALITHAAYLDSICLYLDEGGGSRGSYLVEESSSFKERNYTLDSYAVKSKWNGDSFNSFLEKVRTIPEDKNWFETIWKEYEDGSWIS